MRFISILFVLFVVTHPASAEVLVVDGSTRESYERSVKAMAESLPEEDREVFAKGLINLIITRYPPAQGAEGFQVLQFMQPAAAAAHITLDGVTRSEILEKGREIAAKAAERASEKDDPEVDPNADLRACIKERVLLSNASVEKGDFDHTIKMDVTNNLPWAIAGIRIAYRVTSEGRSVPWEKDDFSLGISGGVEPGETRTIRASISRITPDAPPQLIATVEALDLADPEERQLIRDVRVMGWAKEASDLPCE
jgi:hypothetical protein